jgi:menaquinone-dependent protoporphyrinogen oxidase
MDMPATWKGVEEMKVLVSYASTEGQTRKIARHVAAHVHDTGHSVELLPLADADDIELDRFDRVILAASIHAGHYQRALAEFATAQAGKLAGRPSLFLSVSLAAAGHDSDDWRSLERILQDFREATGWTPGQTVQVAGAYRPSQYDVFRRFVMRRILAAKDPEADPEADLEYTDWAALDREVDAWLDSAAAGAGPA